jgi:hypothetical protein
MMHASNIKYLINCTDAKAEVTPGEKEVLIRFEDGSVIRLHENGWQLIGRWGVVIGNYDGIAETSSL